MLFTRKSFVNFSITSHLEGLRVLKIIKSQLISLSLVHVSSFSRWEQEEIRRHFQPFLWKSPLLDHLVCQTRLFNWAFKTLRSSSLSCWPDALAHLGLSRGLLMTQLAFSKTQFPRKRRSEQEKCFSVFYNLISKETCHHFCYILWTAPTNPKEWEGTKWRCDYQEAGIIGILEAGYNQM